MKIAVIGAGNMGGAIAKGLLNKGIVNPENMIIFDPALKSFADGVIVYPALNGVVAECDFVFIAVKPWIAADVMRSVAELVKDSRTAICSIVAGVDLTEMEQVLGDRPLFRIMPNTAVGVGQGMTFICSQGATDAVLNTVERMMGALGLAMVVPQKQMDGCMALASCGIAYALRYVRAASEGGVELGVPAAQAQAIVAQTLRGAAALLDGGSHPEVEIDKVTTAGGITIRGLNAMEQNGFTNAVIQGLKASVVAK